MVKKNAWTEAEDEKLMLLYESTTPNSAMRWITICEAFPNRTKSACEGRLCTLRAKGKLGKKGAPVDRSRAKNYVPGAKIKPNKEGKVFKRNRLAPNFEAKKAKTDE